MRTPAADELDRPLVETEDYVVIPSRGSIVPGWLMIVPREHCFNMSKHYPKSELKRLQASVSNHLNLTYGKFVTIFEHGATAANSVLGCGVDHAHLHLVPLGLSLMPYATAIDSSLSWSAARASSVANLADGGEYLFCSDGAEPLDSVGLFARVASPRSQFFRMAIANATGLSERYDYRRHAFKDNVRETIRGFATWPAVHRLVA